LLLCARNDSAGEGQASHVDKMSNKPNLPLLGYMAGTFGRRRGGDSGIGLQRIEIRDTLHEIRADHVAAAPNKANFRVFRAENGGAKEK